MKSFFYRFCLSVPILLYCFLLNYLISFSTANGIKWPTREQEEIDEINDAKIIVAVQRSMHEWEKTKLHNKHHRKKRADKSICYGELGCFEDSGPFGYLDMLPSSPEEIDTQFYFYSTKNR